MKKFLHSGLCAVGMIVLINSCVKHDPTYDDVTPPKIDIASLNVSGYVYGMDGQPIAGAKVDGASLGTSTTDQNGYYSISVGQQGEYSLTASSDGCISRTASISIVVSKPGSDVNVSQDFVLPRIQAVPIVNGEAETKTVAIPENDMAVIDLGATITLPETETLEIVLVPIYDAADGGLTPTANTPSANTKATIVKGTSEMLLCGLTIITPGSDIEQLPSTMTVSIGIDRKVNDNVVLKQFKGGEWVEYAKLHQSGQRFEDGKGLVFDVVDVTSYGIFADVDETLTPSLEPIRFEPQSIDNLYGEETIHGFTTSYLWTSGIIIDPAQAGDQLAALLLEKLVSNYGLNKAVSTTEQKTLDIDIPVGTAVEWSGTQTKNVISYTCDGSWAEGIKYTDVNINVITYNRRHTGGSSL